jgi:hypothetical protein
MIRCLADAAYNKSSGSDAAWSKWDGSDASDASDASHQWLCCSTINRWLGRLGHAPFGALNFPLHTLQTLRLMGAAALLISSFHSQPRASHVDVTLRRALGGASSLDLHTHIRVGSPRPRRSESEADRSRLLEAVGRHRYSTCSLPFRRSSLCRPALRFNTRRRTTYSSWPMSRGGSIGPKHTPNRRR